LPRPACSSWAAGAARTWRRRGRARRARPAEEEVPELKGQPGKDIVVLGGAGFARSLAAQGLIDEYRINVQPVALGDGLPLLHGLDEPLRLELVSSTAWADGPITQPFIPR
jgi:dihydrofolate reductase